MSEKPKTCEFCKKEKCDCPRFTCPIHGMVKAVLTTEEKITKIGNGKDATEVSDPYYRCSVEDCTIKRTKKEM